MEGLAPVLEALAALAWPLLLGVLLFRLRHILPGLFESTKSRRFTIKLAGSELIQQIREVDPDVPILVYTSSGDARHRGPQARAAGVSVVTSSPTSLLRGLDLRSGRLERP